MEDEEDWLIRTASTLALARLEDKGCSWLVQRESSTSLSLGGGLAHVHDEDGGSAAAGHGQDFEEEEGEGQGGYADGDGEGEGPDFVEGFADDDDDDEAVAEDGGEGVVDESEMRRVVMGRVGGWVDWAVGWMDFRGREEEDGEEEGGEGDDGEGLEEGKGNNGRRGFPGEKKEKMKMEEGPPIQGTLDVAEVERRLKGRVDVELNDDDDEAEESVSKSSSPPPPPALPGTNVSLVSDARWLLGLMARDIAL